MVNVCIGSSESHRCGWWWLCAVGSWLCGLGRAEPQLQDRPAQPLHQLRVPVDEAEEGRVVVGVHGGEAVTRRQGFDHDAQLRLADATVTLLACDLRHGDNSVSKGLHGATAPNPYPLLPPGVCFWSVVVIHHQAQTVPGIFFSLTFFSLYCCYFLICCAIAYK